MFTDVTMATIIIPTDAIFVLGEIRYSLKARGAWSAFCFAPVATP